MIRWRHAKMEGDGTFPSEVDEKSAQGTKQLTIYSAAVSVWSRTF